MPGGLTTPQAAEKTARSNAMPLLVITISSAGQLDVDYKVTDKRSEMIDLMPFPLFDGNCAEATTFHHGCLGMVLTLTKLGDSPNLRQVNAEGSGRRAIMRIWLESQCSVISAASRSTL
jgi:hypothetical protein